MPLACIVPTRWGSIAANAAGYYLGRALTGAAGQGRLGTALCGFRAGQAQFLGLPVIPWVPPTYGYNGYMALELFSSSDPSGPVQTLTTFVTLGGAPTFDFSPYQYSVVNSGFDSWRLKETGFGVVYLSDLIP